MTAVEVFIAYVAVVGGLLCILGGYFSAVRARLRAECQEKGHLWRIEEGDRPDAMYCSRCGDMPYFP